VTIERGAERYGRVDVRDCYLDLDIAALKRLRDRELVEVPRVVIVDRGP
jgi:hypothetical protein